jgi:hypothetical protein
VQGIGIDFCGIFIETFFHGIDLRKIIKDYIILTPGMNAESAVFRRPEWAEPRKYWTGT